MSSNSSSPLHHSRSRSGGHATAARALHALHPTPSEALLWSRLRGRRLGVRFRRQVVVGSHIVDFMAPAAGLVVEVDGDGYHAGRVAADRCRDEKLRRAGYVVLRLPASLVERRLDEAVEVVREALLRAAAR